MISEHTLLIAFGFWILRHGSRIFRDVRAVLVKFNATPTPKHASMNYYHQRRSTAIRAEGPMGPAIIANAYQRLQIESYKEKGYASYRQFYIDMQAVMVNNADTCKRRLKSGLTVGETLRNGSTRERFGFYVNIAVYRAKTGRRAQFGTTPVEGINRQLKGSNANVYKSTRERIELTLEWFTVSKLFTNFLTTQFPLETYMLDS